MDLVGPSIDLGEDRGDHGPGRLAGPVGVEGAEDGNRQPEGVVVDEGPDLGALPKQSLDQVAPDEALATGDEDALARPLIHGRTYSSSPRANWWRTSSNSSGLPMSNHFSRTGKTCTGSPSARTVAMRSGIPMWVFGGTKRRTS